MLLVAVLCMSAFSSCVVASSTIGSCSDGVQALVGAHNRLITEAGALYDAFDELVKQYERDMAPGYAVSLWGWEMGYKSSMLRRDTVYAENATIAAMSKAYGQVFGLEWPTVMATRLCSAGDLAKAVAQISLLQTGDSIMLDTASTQFLKAHPELNWTQREFVQYPGMGYATAVALDAAMLGSLRRK